MKAEIQISGYCLFSGVYKANSDNSLILLGGGGHKAISDFALSSQLGSYVTSNTTQTIDATKTIGFQNTIYSGWDRSSVANPQIGPFRCLILHCRELILYMEMKNSDMA